VSVVVPVYNGAGTLEACLQSLREQVHTFDKVQLIVVDNASTDDTPRILERHRDRIEVVYESRRGPAAARNRGLREARHDVVAMTDADCVADPHWLRHLVAPLGDPSVAVVGGRIRCLEPCNHVEAFGDEIHDHALAITQYKPPYVITMNWASRRSLLEAVGYFDESLTRGEDVEFSYRVARAGHRMAYAPDALIHHRNEDTLRGLFREGVGHGFHSVRVTERHRAYLDSLGNRRFTLAPYRGIAVAIGDCLGGRDAPRALCRAVFHSGREVGKVAGVVRRVMFGSGPSS